LELIFEKQGSIEEQSGIINWIVKEKEDFQVDKAG
jgi:hypothetical protein